MTYADTGLLVSVYRPTETLSRVARRAIGRAPVPVMLSPLSLLEIRNALNLAISRKELTEAGREMVLGDIHDQLEAGFFRMIDVSQTRIYAKAAELSNRHTSTCLARSLDLIHVAAALLSGASVFLSTDARQRKVASAEGLTVRP